MKKAARGRVKHLQEHANPTVIHDPLADETILARWLRIGLEKGPKFWLLGLGSVAAIAVLTVILLATVSGGSAADPAWEPMILAQTPEDQARLAEGTDPIVASWAALHAAESTYLEGFRDLPMNRDAALPTLKKAIDLFEEAADKAPPGAPQKRMAALGVARTLEARGEIDEALERYRAIATNRDWAGSYEATVAERQVRALQDPANVEFYQRLATLKPSDFPPARPSPTFPGLPPGLTLPPGASDMLNLPAGHPLLDGPRIPAPDLPIVPDLPSGPSGGDARDPAPTPETTEEGAASLPADPFSGEGEAPQPEPAPPGA